MTRPHFLTDLADPLPGPGSGVRLDGEEGRHAAVVRRIVAGEEIVLTDGRGRGLIAEVTAADKQGLDLVVRAQLTPAAPARRITVAQALAKGDRGELAVAMMTEVGVAEILAWQASRSIVRWVGERGAKSLRKWTSVAREATKQSRRLRVPAVEGPLSTAQLEARIAAADLALLLHEEAGESLAEQQLPDSGEVLLVVGPEGGISPEELQALTAAGARPVTISDGVLRTSTAGVVAAGHLALPGAGSGPGVAATGPA